MKTKIISAHTNELPEGASEDHPSESIIQRLINLLNNLRDGEDAMDRLVACGARAIPFVQKYLIEGKPSHIYQPRQRAVKVLAKLGAKEALIQYLSTPREIADPIIRFGEEAVENEAARALSAWNTEDVFETLLSIAHVKHLSGVIETLGSFQRVETIPVFIEALGDDMCTTAAMDALRRLGKIVKPALIYILGNSEDHDYYESPSNMMRRRSAIQILNKLSVTPEEWQTIRGLLHDKDAVIRIAASRLALDSGALDDKSVALEKLIEAIPYSEWYLQVEIEDYLLKHSDFAGRRIETEVTKRLSLFETTGEEDPILQTLLHIRRKIKTNGNRRHNGSAVSQYHEGSDESP